MLTLNRHVNTIEWLKKKGFYDMLRPVQGAENAIFYLANKAIKCNEVERLALIEAKMQNVYAYRDWEEMGMEKLQHETRTYYHHV